MTPFLKQCVITMGMMLNNIVQGCECGFPAVLLPHLESEMKISKEDESWIASVPALTMFVGNLLTAPAMQRGRKLTHHFVSLLNIVSWLFVAFAPNYQVLMIGRIIQGMAFGLFYPVIGVMLAEYTSPVYRGYFLVTIPIGQTLGVFLIHLLGSFLTWRNAALLLSFFPVISFAITVLVPESPSWLALVGRYDECRKAFRWLRCPDEEEELHKMVQARQHLNHQAKLGRNILRQTIRSFSRKELLMPLLLGASMYVLSENSGTLLFACYMEEILHTLIGPNCNIYTWMTICDGIRLGTNCIALYVVGKLKRRQMLFFGGIINVTAYFTQAAYVYAKSLKLVDNLWLPATLLFFHAVTVGLAMMVVPGVIVGEIYPLQYKSICSCINSVTFGVCVFLTLKTFPGVFASIGLDGAYLVYGVIQVAVLVVNWFLLPETYLKTLQEIEESFKRKPVTHDDEATVSLNDGRKIEENRS